MPAPSCIAMFSKVTWVSGGLIGGEAVAMAAGGAVVGSGVGAGAEIVEVAGGSTNVGSWIGGCVLATCAGVGAADSSPPQATKIRMVRTLNPNAQYPNVPFRCLAIPNPLRLNDEAGTPYTMLSRA